MEEVKEFTKLEIRNYSELESSFLKSSSILKREYLNNLSEYDIVPIMDSINEIEIPNRARFYQVSKLVYNEDESFIEKLTTIARAAHIAKCSLVSLLTCDGEKTEFYVGMVNKAGDQSITDEITPTIEGAIIGNFPGSALRQCKGNELREKIDEFQDSSVISAISNVASLRNEEQDIKQYVQGIEKLVDSLNGKKYTIITIADPVSNAESSLVQDSLEQLYSQLSGFAKTDMSLNENSNIANSEQYSKGYSDSIGINTSISQSHTSQTGWSESHGESKGKSTNMGSVAVALAGVAAVGLTVATGGLAAVAAAATAGAAISTTAVAGGVGAAAISAAGSVAGGLIGSKNKTSSDTHGTSGSESNTENRTEGKSTNHTESINESTGVTKSLGAGRTMSFSVENRAVKSILEEIDKQLERLNECGSYGSFSSCTYVLTDDIQVNMLASSVFNALMSGEKSNIQVAKVNTWGIESTPEDESNVESLKKYLMKLTHPQFADAFGEYVFTPASLVSGKELSIQLGFPKKSIAGLSIVYKVPFGRNVITPNTSNRKISIGKIYNMGITEAQEVKLDLDSLTSHLFVTGSTGTGKSNTIYKLLEGICIKDPEVKFMVIEPAKGEYKHAFYKHPKIDVNVYGTNPKKSELIRLNPFSFPDDIHVLEHIDRLVEILNVCWPMYAAMPAILKNAIIKSYEICGWDMTNSECMGGTKIYPCFDDVLNNIHTILNSSDFSQDNKGDYTGALCTRVESLTTGINGQIFTANELSMTNLLNQNVVIDLSRVGAVETKSLIMGILVMKLQEERMSQELIPNQNLRHIVVMEEAHNLLKKTSTEQSTDSANLVGKSVEMITNAIAEMRTYGEAFFIVDQAPNLLDTAVIRNTNTKIVLRLPEDSDREIVGKSMSLSDEQIRELSKLDKGCAAVYQNDWEEAVLCKFEQYHKDYNHTELDGELFKFTNRSRLKSKAILKKDIMRLCMDIITADKADEKIDKIYELERVVAEISLSQILKKKIQNIANDESYRRLDYLAGIICDLYSCSGIIEKQSTVADIEEWNHNLIISIDPELERMSANYINLLIQCMMVDQVNRNPEFKPYAENWIRKMEELSYGGKIR